ncbi:hypothetical protein KKF05_01320 [Patescibacteria group bacterium]|nr:hypothetical protein [Patescibacteria group bacterium]MBU1028915.1 hypothetical protein [Patescibacteria group bacterium]
MTNEGWSCRDEVGLATGCLEEAEIHLSQKNGYEALIELSLAEHHLRQAQCLVTCRQDELIIGERQLRLKALICRLGWFWRIVRRIYA